jgi:hypothetical protein
MKPALGERLRSRQRNARMCSTASASSRHWRCLRSDLQRPARRGAQGGDDRHAGDRVDARNLAFTMMWDRGLGPMHTRAWTLERRPGGVAQR